MGYALGLMGRTLLRTGLALLTVPVGMVVLLGTVVGVTTAWTGLAGLLGWWGAAATGPAVVKLVSGLLLLAAVSLIRVAWADLQAAARV